MKGERWTDGRTEGVRGGRGGGGEGGRGRDFEFVRQVSLKKG